MVCTPNSNIRRADGKKPFMGSERQHIRAMMMSFSNSGRFGDWMGVLLSDADFPERPAKIYKLMAEDAQRAGRLEEAEHFMVSARELWPEVDRWTGREKKYLA